MKPALLFICFALFRVLLPAAAEQSTKTVVLPDLICPRYVNVDHQRFYIVESRKRVTGYSVDDFKKNLEINARKGKGPGEYVNVPMVVPYGEHIIIKTTNKIAYYSRQGKYLHEKRLKRIGVIEPLGDGYLFWYFAYSKEERSFFTVIEIQDSNQQRLKKIYKYKAPKMNYIVSGGSRRGRFDLLRENLSTVVCNNHIYIADPSRGFFITVIDHKGRVIGEISKNYPKTKITTEDRKRLIEKAMYINGYTKQTWKRMRQANDLHCPEFFPAFEKITVSDDRIYVKTYKSRDGKREFIILDLNGKEIKRVYLEDADMWAIRDSTYYFISFSEDKDEWSLNRSGI
ncbi:MAG: hypothetical protein GTO45_40820 [Candidatus Aminicenantes bacterium]|nr:hypothetical protein [Candidatus Aminicenantes bacterium]NIM84948.1 hypothetical protein [Candidatus Aminicenantes bacterium]NIN24462.1 hypothetical protein [Candidatus Aminicenantes bacterium]NIN48226.1 hypothetical protein [Candidatus Aminicenantes bacterium]NIN91129.1 hypothetical protein [Candidatus Aminicenantes bacterium]